MLIPDIEQKYLRTGLELIKNIKTIQHQKNTNNRKGLTMKKIAECLITKSNEMIQMDTGHVKLTYYFKEGVYDLEYQDSPYPSIKGIGFQFRFQKRVYTQEHIKSSTPDIFITERQDTFGTYAELCISRIYGELKVKQYFSMLPQVSYLLVRCEIEGKDIIRSNYIAPMISTGEAFSLKDTARPRLLYVPYIMINGRDIKHKKCRNVALVMK